MIATTTLGAKAGFVALWIILLSCVIKVAIQLEFGKNAICHGKTVMKTFNDLPGLGIKGTNWTIWMWFFPALWAILFLVVKLPVLMVTIGGTATGIMLLIVVYVSLNYKYKLSVARLEAGKLYNIVFIISASAIAFFAAYSLYAVFK